jgi:hypothetical protein
VTARKPLPPVEEYRLALRASAEIEARSGRTKSARDLGLLRLLEDYRRGQFALIRKVAT